MLWFQVTNGIFFSPSQWRIPAQPELPGRGAASLLPGVSAGGQQARGSCSPGGCSRQVLLVRCSVRVAAGLPDRPLKVAEPEARCPAEAAGRSWSVRFVSRALRSAGAAWGQLSRCRRWPPRLTRTRPLENLHPGPSRCWAPRRWGRGLCGLPAAGTPRRLTHTPGAQGSACSRCISLSQCHAAGNGACPPHPEQGLAFPAEGCDPAHWLFPGSPAEARSGGDWAAALGRRAGQWPGEGGEQTRREGRRIFWSRCLAALRVRAGAAAR